MFEEMVEELFKLSRQAVKTGAYVSITVLNSWANVNILDAGWDEKKDFDGYYKLYNTSGSADIDKENFQAAKEHLEKLIKEKKK